MNDLIRCYVCGQYIQYCECTLESLRKYAENSDKKISDTTLEAALKLNYLEDLCKKLAQSLGNVLKFESSCGEQDIPDEDRKEAELVLKKWCKYEI